MSHLVVIHENKTLMKMSIVLDASSSESNFPSFNDCLSQSLNLTPDILKFFSQFHLNKIGIMVDTEGAFLKIALMCEIMVVI